MKKIERMSVTVTYHVELKGVEVPDNVKECDADEVNYEVDID